MIPASTIVKLATLGLSADQAEAVAEMLADVERATEEKANASIQVADMARKELRKARNKRYYDSNKTHQDASAVFKTHQDAQDASAPSPKEKSPTPPKEITPTPNPSLRSGSLSARARVDFESFWQAWPNKVGKPAALKSFERIARQADYDLQQILTGVEAYKRNKPFDRSWLNPATFLNQERWKDQLAPQARAGPAAQPQFRNPHIVAYLNATGARDVQPAEYGSASNLLDLTVTNEPADTPQSRPDGEPNSDAADDRFARFLAPSSRG